MTIKTPSVSSHAEPVEIPAAANLSAALPLPLRAGARDSFLALVETECEQIRRSVTDRAYSQMRETEENARLAAERAAAGRASFDEARKAATHADRRGGCIKTTIWALCAAACFSAEFVLSWNALCFVLNVEKPTVLGVLLGLAPPSALAVLEIVFARLFEDPWQESRNVAASSRRSAVRAIMAVMLLVLAAGNGITIWHLAKAREVAAQLEDIMNRGLPPETADREIARLDRGAVDRAVLWVSLVVSVDGAIFLLLSLAAGKELRNRRIADRELVTSRAESARLETESATASAAADTSREAWRTIREKAEEHAGRYRAYCVYVLLQREAAAAAEETLAQQVANALQSA